MRYGILFRKHRLSLLIFTLINYYIGSQSKLFHTSIMDVPLHWVYWLIFWLLANSYMIARLGSSWMPKAVSQFIKIVGSYWFAIMTYGLLLLPVIDLVSGHTHRGQMTPFHWITKRINELDWGYLKKGNRHTIVSSGFGSWGPPIRLGSRSEIIEIIIQFKPPV